MNCADCGGAVRTSIEDLRYRDCGLDNVVIKDVRMRVCSECGGRELVLARVEELHRVIARGLSGRPRRLAPREIRFLRKHLGLSSVGLAKRMGVAPETVSRWEREGTPARMKQGLERYLRLMVLKQLPADRFSLETLDELAVGKPAAGQVRIFQRRGRWAVDQPAIGGH